MLAPFVREINTAFRQSWLQGLERFAVLWAKGCDAEDRWRREPKAWYGSREVVVDVDYALYLQSARMRPPPAEKLHGHVLLAVSLPAFVSMVRAHVIGEVSASGDICPWYEFLGPLHELDPIGLIVAKLLLPMAIEDMSSEKKRMSSAREQAGITGEAGTGPLSKELRVALESLRDNLDTKGARRQLSAALEELQSAGLRVIRLAPVEGQNTKIRSSLDSLMSGCIAMQAELDKVDSIQKVNAIWLSPKRLAVGGGFMFGIWTLIPENYAYVLFAFAISSAGWRYLLLNRARMTLKTRVKAFTRLCERVLGRVGNRPDPIKEASMITTKA